ncbi:multidrug transporter [Mangrovimonas sp. AS39]|uniref:multidrug transporter n=1 Tax=Mangrovimonas futianensis TaxID=2895523 RepID=UPI001E52E77E|nr:multidrug transporter [Mangrovimonas futianensis]MCF1190066.1 multidrug transporter [Mangrovimonas futianensis]MCF1194183.1 multidrug transporter [Mangrovimonas futianensis]
MKNNFILGLAIISMLFSCTTDDTADIVINDNSDNSTTIEGGNGGNTGETVYLSGTYTSDLTLDINNNYVINGPLIMASGTTLTIPPCMTIEALAAGANVYVAIAQGAQIDANGTADCPIVFTSNATNPAAGDWGGLILLGRAPINSVTGSATSTSEIASLPYGGTNEADNSGSLQYVRVEYGGGAADGQSENNGFSFYGVGNGTTVNYIQGYVGKDDGIEFFGGTVNASHISMIGMEDDSVDWTEGFSGTLTDVYIEHMGDHDKGIEADGYNTDYSNAAGYYSKPTINNLHIVGLGSETGNEAVRLRAGTQGIFNNVLIEGFDEGFDLDGDSGDNPTGAGVISGDLHITDVTFNDVTTKVKNDTGVTFTEGDIITGDGNGNGTDYTSWGAGWTHE